MSLIWLDAKYLGMLSFRLRNFKKRGTNNWNFSCPFCGDSKTNKHKARGYVYPVKGKLRFYCHNCNVPGVDVAKLVKHEDQLMYEEYVKEKLISQNEQRVKSDVEVFAEKMKPPVFVKQGPLKDLKKISQFKPESAVRQYIDGRMIPSEYHYKLFFCKEFKKWVNTFVPNKFESESNDEPRLIIPFLDQDKNLFGFQGRSFRKNSKLRYITIILDDTKPKLFGLDTVNLKLPIYVVEGPIDSMFLPNAIAMAGSDGINALPSVTTDKDQFCIVYDNEPRNKEICKKIEKAIDNNYKVCIWPDNIVEKDINDMILSGFSQKNIVDIILQNTYNGLEAKLRLQAWRKINV